MYRLLELHVSVTVLSNDWYLKPYCKTYSKAATSDTVIYTESEKTNGSAKQKKESMNKNAQRLTKLFKSLHNYLFLNIMHQAKLVKIKAYTHC